MLREIAMISTFSVVSIILDNVFYKKSQIFLCFMIIFVTLRCKKRMIMTFRFY